MYVQIILCQSEHTTYRIFIGFANIRKINLKTSSGIDTISVFSNLYAKTDHANP